ncbi:CapA family protein [Candidatus Woesebacteria bacterium]|nr:CapA family protein [Candidatus Woesebacteria bacterium]
MGRLTALLLILAASVFGLTLWATNPDLREVKQVFPLETFNRDIEIVLAGDVMLGRSVMAKILEVGDPFYPFKAVADRLKEADLVFVNLENPVTRDCKPHLGGFTFCTTPEIAEGLNFAGVDIVNLANNHTFNYGRGGFEETKEILDEQGVKWVGDNNLEVVTLKGTVFGFLGFDLTVKGLSQENLELIKKADGEVDVLVVAVHWGVEYTREPTKLQRTQAREIIKAGADVISGHHPHWVQISETIEEKPVYYSLGNFIFDQMWSEETKKGVVVSLTYKDGELKKAEEFPTYMKNWAQPEFIPQVDN